MKRKLLLSLGTLAICVAPIAMASCQNKQQQAKDKVKDFIEKIKAYLAKNAGASDEIKSALTASLTAMEEMINKTDFSSITNEQAEQIMKAVDTSIASLEEMLNIKL